MKSEKQLTGEESIRLIQQMIQSVRQEVRDNGFYFLLWGWLVFASSMFQFMAIQLKLSIPYWLGWMVLMPAGGIITSIYGIKEEKARRVKTQFDEFLKYVLHAFLVSLFFVLLAMPILKSFCYPMIMVVYAIWLYISGGALQFNALRVGALVNWMLAAACLFVEAIEWQSLLLATAVLLGYIIPGYMLKSKYERSKKHAEPVNVS